MSARAGTLCLLALALAAGGLAVRVQAGGSTPAARSSAACKGTFRWQVKTLSDARAKLVDYRPRSARLVSLTHLARPAGVTRATPRLAGDELRTYRIQVALKRVVMKPDREIRLVVANPKTKRTMVVEFADPTCGRAKHSRKRQRLAVARASFLASCGIPPKGRLRKISGSATITGVGFFDKKYRALGNAPNGFELHPVLSFLGLCKARP
jgi:hypothetical protein